jgi:hypothetical protein
MDGEPLDAAAAKTLARTILDSGSVVWSSHALAEMAKDGLSTPDGLNTIRAGAYQPAELVGRQWRYRIQTQRMTFVIAFTSETELRVVTAWRHRR